MIDSRLTLSKLHSKFPNLTLDDLFEILDCYTEMPSMWTNNDKTITWPLTNVKYGNPTCTATANFEVPKKCD
jgi:hypothetical protein